MNCSMIKKLLYEYQDGALKAPLMAEIKSHLPTCPACAKEYQEIQKAWDLLNLAPEIKPQADYMSRFWTKVSLQETPQERLIHWLRSLLGQRALVPVAVGLSVMVIVGSVLLTRHGHEGNVNQISNDDVEMLQNFDLAKHFDTIKDLEVIQTLNT